MIQMQLHEALSIIDRATYWAAKGPGAGPDVVEALKFLQSYGVERQALVWFWRALRTKEDVGRQQNVHAAKARIHLLVHKVPAPRK